MEEMETGSLTLYTLPAFYFTSSRQQSASETLHAKMEDGS